ncbi:MAG: DUF3127 domain-containing protein [Prevotella sp.]|nr:DUF3127 domain-containing protein [Prevotella sp.]
MRLLDLRQGISEQTGREWHSREIVLEATDAVMYPDLIVASLRGEDAENPVVQEGDIVEVVLNFFAHEKDGRWFNNVRVIKIEKP